MPIDMKLEVLGKVGLQILSDGLLVHLPPLLSQHGSLAIAKERDRFGALTWEECDNLSDATVSEFAKQVFDAARCIGYSSHALGFAVLVVIEEKPHTSVVSIQFDDSPWQELNTCKLAADVHLDKFADIIRIMNRWPFTKLTWSWSE